MMTEIIRTPTKVAGGVTPEEMEKLKVHTDMWIKRILSTEHADFSKLEPAIKGLYRVANLSEPEVILVESPIMMAFMYGVCSVLCGKNPKASVREILDNTHKAMNDHPIDADVVEHYTAVTKKLAGKKGIENTKQWSDVYQGGAYFAHYDCYLTAMRDVLGLRLKEHENYKYWEESAIHGTFRVMHQKFCIVSDFPEILKIDDQNRPHGQNGPSHRWRDGWSLYHWHGVEVPANWITNPESLAAKDAIRWPNIEQRRAACEILGWSKILDQLKAKVIDTDGDPEIGQLVEVTLPDIGKEKFLRVRCGTGRDFALPVPPEMKTALQAQSWTWGLDEKDFIIPEVRT
jgi:hypothetical protein